MGRMEPEWGLALAKCEWEEADRAAKSATAVASQAHRGLDAGHFRDIPPEMQTSVEELEKVAAEKRQTFFEALARDLLCSQHDEGNRRRPR